MKATLLVILWTACLPAPAMAVDTLADIMAGTSRSAPIIGLQVVTLKNGEIDQSVALGLAQIAPDVPLSTHHRMRVASISKLVTAIAAMQLVERGDATLDGDISYLLGWRLRNPNFPDTPITLRHLLNHTSSIRDGDYYWLKPGDRLREFFMPPSVHFMAGIHFASGKNQSPGDFFTYSNLNFGVIAAIIEVQTGEQFDRYVKKHILAPLGMEASFSPCDIPASRLATLYRGSEPQVDGATLACHYGATPLPRGSYRPDRGPFGYWPGENPTLFSPQGGLRASAEDLARLAKIFIGKGAANGVRILSPETMEQMLAPSWTFRAEPIENGETGGEDPSLVGLMTAYGLSVHIADMQAWGLTNTPKLLYGHLGEAYGFLGNFWLDPTTGDGIIALITGTETPAVAARDEASPLTGAETAILKWWLDQSRHDGD